MHWSYYSERVDQDRFGVVDFISLSDADGTFIKTHIHIDSPELKARLAEGIPVDPVTASKIVYFVQTYDIKLHHVAAAYASYWFLPPIELVNFDHNLSVVKADEHAHSLGLLTDTQQTVNALVVQTAEEAHVIPFDGLNVMSGQSHQVVRIPSYLHLTTQRCAQMSVRFDLAK